MTAYTPEHRRGLVKALTSTGTPILQAQEIVDLACQAAEEAVRKVVDVSRLGSSLAVKMMTLEIALQLAAAQMTGAAKRLHSEAASEGVPQFTSMVEVPA